MEKKVIKSFDDLKVWQDAHKLALKIYRETDKFPKTEQFSLTDQIRRSASSVGANIAEGFGRYHFKDKIRFYQQARGSIFETQNHAALAKDLGYIGEECCSDILLMSNEVAKEINGLIRTTGDVASNLMTND
jgi:four helix bundle protein